MNILFFPYNAYPPEMGGIARITCCLIDEFRKNGINVFKLGHRKSPHSTVDDIRQFYLPDSSRILTDENIRYSIDICNDHQIDIIINQSPLGDSGKLMFEVCEKTKTKSISCFHTSILTPILNHAYVREYRLKNKGAGIIFELLKTPVIKSLSKWLYIKKYRKQHREIVDNSSAVVLLCDGQVEELKQMCGYDDISNAVVIHNCMSKPHYFNVEKEKIILWVGAFDCNIKRPDYMLNIWNRIWAQNNDWKLLMLGDGPQFNEVKELASSMKLKNIEFTGRVNPNEYYNKAQILCVTSIHESFSLVSIEAMFHRMAIIAFDSFSFAPELTNNGKNGLLVNAFDINEYACRLDALMNSVRQMNQMGNNAIQYAEKFTNTSIFPMWDRLFKSLKQ